MSDSARIATGEVLRAIRTDRGLTIEEVARRAKLHYVYYGDIERGKRNPTVTSLDRALAALRVSWAEFGAALDEQRRTENQDGTSGIR